MLPRWTKSLLALLAKPELRDEVIGDLEEVHRKRIEGSGRVVATMVTTLEALDMAYALWRLGTKRRRDPDRSLARDRSWRLPVSWLDFKLGLRMLVRYPGVTVVGGLAIAVSIAIGASVFQFATELVFPDHPYEDPSRIVGILTIDSREGGLSRRTLHDLGFWRHELRTIDHVGARRTTRVNLDVGSGRPEPVAGVEISSAAFRLAPVAPVVGRPLLETDEAQNAVPVTVLSHHLWQSMFGGTEDVVGRIVRVEGRPTTVVGVMPGGFVLRVPSNDIADFGAQDLWTPFRLDPAAYEPQEGPSIDVFGRLALGATPSDAVLELRNRDESRAADAQSYAGVTRRVATFANPFGGFDRGLGIRTVMFVVSLFIAAVVVTLCANVALLLFARAATRENELVVRNALGASRARIVAQLLAEALGLAAVGLGVGWVGAAIGLRWMVDTVTAVTTDAFLVPPPIDAGLAPRTIAYATGLAVGGAIVAGVLPGIKATRDRMGGSLARVSGRGSSAIHDRTWGAIIITQVALTTTLAPVGIVLGVQTWESMRLDRGFAAWEYVSVRLEMDRELSPTGEPVLNEGEFLEVYENRVRELQRRVEAEPGVMGVTLGHLPGFEHAFREMELDLPAPSPAGPWIEAQVATVGPEFFDVIGMRVLSGRGFDSRDQLESARTVIVNESFVRAWLGGENAVGRRLRYPDGTQRVPPDTRTRGAEPWMEIVGVVSDVVMTVEPGLSMAGVYQARLPATTSQLRMAAHVPGRPAEFVGRLRELAAEVSTELRVDQARTLDRAGTGALAAWGFMLKVIIVTGGLALLLALAGIYAIMAFTVSRRTREIGVRVALGGEPRDIVYSTLSHMRRRVTLGVLCGAVPGLLLSAEMTGRFEASGGSLANGAVELGLVMVYLVVMIAICMTACIVPIRRALAIQPAEALSAEG